MITLLAAALISFGPYSDVTITKVYDGDTFTAIVGVWPNVSTTMSIRVNGIDTPELRGKCEEEKALARKAKTFTIDWLYDNMNNVVLGNVKNGKYAGRVVADVLSASGESLASALVQNNLGYEYHGGKRKSWCDGQ